MTSKSSTTEPGFRLSLFFKILLATLISGLLPLLVISYRSTIAINQIGDTAQGVAATELDIKSIEALQVRGEQAASRIATMLEASVQDTLYVSRLSPSLETFSLFYKSRRGWIWYLVEAEDGIRERKQFVPLYREIAYIDPNGKEIIRIVDGVSVEQEQLRDISDPVNADYFNNNYYVEARGLPQGEVYVSPVIAWYITQPNQPAQGADIPTSPFRYVDYEAVIQFAAPVYDDSSEFQGVVVLSLDHRHIMEVVNHIQSTSKVVPYPDYQSGSYAYLIDFEGWLISHPDLAALRGLDENGDLMPTIMLETVDETLPLNMLESDRKEEAKIIAGMVLAGETGNVRSVTRAGAPKVDVYVPIHFSHGAYQQKGIFGGVILSENVLSVEKAGEISRQIIGEAANKIRRDVVWIVGVSVLAFLTAAILLSRNITDPIRQLTEAARIMEKGELDIETLNRLIHKKVDDEVRELTRVFKQMAEAVQLRERRLREEVQLLRIQIDEKKKKEEVDKIVQSESFKDLQEKARLMRARRKSR